MVMYFKLGNHYSKLNIVKVVLPAVQEHFLVCS